MAANLPVVCLVTVHGVGFQQRPVGDEPGYADGLHAGLRPLLDELGDDPERPDTGGPVYVQSTWPPDSRNVEAGLERLGSWQPGGAWRVDASRPLAGPGARIAHVALVYSHLEEQYGDPVAAAAAAVLGASLLTHYASVTGLVRGVVHDVAAILAHQAPPAAGAGPGSLRVRSEAPALQQRLAHLGRAPSADAPADGLVTVLQQLEDDVCAYVCRNVLRERVRAFVREALTRLAMRDDVAAVVVNGHSNGTVVAHDVLATLPLPVISRVAAVVTAGSPLRKYVDLLAWGTDGGALGHVARDDLWTNFYDPVDPVADPLGPPAEWRRGGELPADGGPGLFASDMGTAGPIRVVDERLDNLSDSAGTGLRAHNYWDNPKFRARLAAVLGAVP
jgi:hypothetical protein